MAILNRFLMLRATCASETQKKRFAALQHFQYFRHVRVSRKKSLLMIPGFRRDVNDICALLGYYAASSGNPSPTFQDNPSVPFSTVQVVPKRRQRITTRRCVISQEKRRSQRLLASSSHVRPSVRMPQLGSHWLRFGEI
jgi:hypothetical protein